MQQHPAPLAPGHSTFATERRQLPSPLTLPLCISLQQDLAQLCELISAATKAAKVAASAADTRAGPDSREVSEVCKFSTRMLCYRLLPSPAPIYQEIEQVQQHLASAPMDHSSFGTGRRCHPLPLTPPLRTRLQQDLAQLRVLLSTAVGRSSEAADVDASAADTWAGLTCGSYPRCASFPLRHFPAYCRLHSFHLPGDRAGAAASASIPNWPQRL